MTTFELGKTYRLEFADGDAVLFTPDKRFKNGNWSGLAADVPAGKKPRKAVRKTVFNPPVAGWKETENNNA